MCNLAKEKKLEKLNLRVCRDQKINERCISLPCRISERVAIQSTVLRGGGCEISLAPFLPGQTTRNDLSLSPGRSFLLLLPGRDPPGPDSRPTPQPGSLRKPRSRGSHSVAPNTRESRQAYKIKCRGESF